jgi:hypothetical protein
MAFDISTAKPEKQAAKGGFDLSTAKPEQDNTDYSYIPGDGEGGRQISHAKHKDRTIGETLGGIGEAALTTVTGATGGALGFIGGTIEGAAKELTGQIPRGEGEKIAQERAAALTYAPRSEAGQEFVGDIGEILGALPPVLGTAPVVGLNAASRIKFAKTKSPLAKKIAESSTGNIQKSFTRKLANERFTPRIFNMVKEARRQGFDDGMTTVIANASPIDKRRMFQQVVMLEKGKKDALFQAKNRPADIAGDSLLRKVNFVKSNNTQAGKQLGRIAESLKGKEVDIVDPVSKFFDDINELGVIIDEDGKPNFAGSQIEGVAPAESLINKIAFRLDRNPTPDAFGAHNFKKFIDENVNFGKAAEGLGGKTERVVKALRSGVNDSISSKYSKYKEANTRFSDTIQALDSLQTSAGKKLDFFGPNSDKATGTVLRRLMSNAQGRVTLMDAIDNIETTTKKYGGSFDDDIMTQMLFADELDAVFGGGGRTSLRGDVKKANIDAAVDISQMTIPGAVAVGVKAGAKRLRGINEKNQLKSIKELLKAEIKKENK